MERNIKINDNSFFSVYYALVGNSPINYLGFKYIRSFQIAPTRKEQIHSKDVKHRLYVTMDYSQLYKFVIKFVKTLEANDMPYNMKVETNMGLRHNDVLVIYIDNEINLLKTINIINGLIDRNLEYQDKIHTPSEHLFNIDDRIGYGFEPPSKDSYSNVLGYTLYDSKEEACKQIVESLIKDYPNKTYMGYKQEFIEAAKNENYSSIIHQKLLKEKNKGKHKYLLYALMKLIRPKVEEEINNSQGIDMNDVFNINSKAKTL